jgi:hypothetical protein
MNRRLTVSLAVLACAALASSPSLAAPKKKAPIKGSYKVQLPPDPSANVFSTAGQPRQCGANTAAQHKHPFTVPAAGTLTVVLDAQDPKPGTPYVFDWDLYLNDAAGSALGEGSSPEAHEEIVQKFKKGATVTFLACNLNGVPDATVSYTFTYA